MNHETQRPTRIHGWLGARVMALVTMSGLLGSVTYVAGQGYRALTDSFVAPVILSPDNDAVIANKLTFSQLQAERAKADSEVEAADADVAATNDAVARLRKLKETISRGVAWATGVNASLASSGAVELQALAHERDVLTQMIDEQRTATKEARANMEAGLIAKSDYMKETQTLSQLQVALLENERTRSQSEQALHTVELTQSSLANKRGAPLTPELVVREDQLVRVELDLLRLESERRAKVAEQELARQRLAKIDELTKQMEARPLFRALEQRINLAFVPYTQMNGVREGSRVYDCVWGLFDCKDVGAIAELVPGEVVLPDPWGNQARGQFVVLELVDHDAAQSKTLRVREVSQPTGPRAVALSVR